MTRAQTTLAGLLSLSLVSVNASRAAEPSKGGANAFANLIKNMSEVQTHSCRVAEAALIVASRIHVRSETPTKSGISYFSLPVGDSPTGDTDAALALSLILAAQTSNRSLEIDYVLIGLGEKFGCLAKDCRTIKTLALAK
jgi:hypothetical protein